MKIKFDNNILTSMNNIDLFFKSKKFEEVCRSKENYSYMWKDNIIGNFEEVFIGENTKIFPGSYIQGPVYIGSNSELRSGSLLREKVFLESDVRIGHSSEVKNSFIGKYTNLAHFNYVGDSYISNNVNLAAGVICSNFKQLPYGGNISFYNDTGEKNDTSCRLLGSFIGSFTKVGCNSVIFPGTYIEEQVVIYPLCSVRGQIQKGQIMKSDMELVKIDERNY